MPQAAETNPKEHQGKNDKELSTILMPQAKHPNLEKDVDKNDEQPESKSQDPV